MEENKKFKSVCSSLLYNVTRFIGFKDYLDVFRDIYKNYSHTKNKIRHSYLEIINNSLLSNKEKEKKIEELKLKKTFNDFTYLTTVYNLSTDIFNDIKRNKDNPNNIEIFTGSKKVKVGSKFIKNKELLKERFNKFEKALNDTNKYISNSEFIISH